ncbi:hypothetical protein AKJ16_DCAP14457 [Drosera capensis]
MATTAMPPLFLAPQQPPKQRLGHRHRFALQQQQQQPILSSSLSNSTRPAVILPGLGNNTSDYDKLKQTLAEEYGVPTVVAKVSRVDWFRNAAGLLDPDYSKGTLRPQSSGGWLARIYMEEFGMSDISLLLTLGTPHTPPPKGLAGVIDQTRGLWIMLRTIVQKLSYLRTLDIYIKGARIIGNSNEDFDYIASSGKDQAVAGATSRGDVAMSMPSSPTLRARFIGQGYKQVCGRADVWGDGVVPELSAHLEGALNLSFDGVYHSPVGSDDFSRPWYGSPTIVTQGVDYLL